ncbi:MAG: hypothetical protein Q9221_002761 [Calogaya cf. arnoldii]
MSGTSDSTSTDDAIVELLTSYHELNGGHVDELEEPPSPLVFMQYIAKNRPFVLRGGGNNWPATSLWDPEYLSMKMGNSRVKVAVTPSGSGCAVDCSKASLLTALRNADSAVKNPRDGVMYFTKPLEVWEISELFVTP